MMNAGIVLRKDDPVAHGYAVRGKLTVTVSQDWALPWERTLFITPGTCVPWELLGVGFNFLAKWDLAAPLWKAGMLARDVGAPADRERTQKVTRDLRVPVYAHELLFVRASEAGRAFLAAWRAECSHGEERLAFVRALYMIKPVFCVLPRLWLADIAQRETGDKASAARRKARQPQPLIRVEVAPGRFVQCYEADRQKVLERYQRLARGRHAR